MRDKRYECPKNPDREKPWHREKHLKCQYCGIKFKRRKWDFRSEHSYDGPDLDGSPSGVEVQPGKSYEVEPGLFFQNSGDIPVFLERIRLMRMNS